MLSLESRRPELAAPDMSWPTAGVTEVCANGAIGLRGIAGGMLGLWGSEVAEFSGSGLDIAASSVVFRARDTLKAAGP